MYIELDRLLSMKASVDYWGDVLIDDAEKELYDFTDEDWRTLKSEIIKKESEWLERCASMLGDSPDPSSLEILIQLLPHSDLEVREVAIDSVRSLLSLGLDGRKYLSEIKNAASNLNKSDELSSSLLELINKEIHKMESNKL